MYEDIYPTKKKAIDGVDQQDEEIEIDFNGNIVKKKKKINLYPKGQTVNKKRISKKARETMRRAMKIRKYIKEDEKDKE